MYPDRDCVMANQGRRGSRHLTNLHRYEDYFVIDDPEAMNRVLTWMFALAFVCVDLEWDSDGVCLIQLCGGADKPAFIFRVWRPAFQVPGTFDTLRALFGDRSVCKVFHDPSQDVKRLANDLQVTVCNLFDTQAAVEFIGKGRQVSYKEMVHGLLGAELDKTARRTKWRNDTLAPHQLRYAAKDVTYLYDCYLILQPEIADDWDLWSAFNRDMELVATQSSTKPNVRARYSVRYNHAAGKWHGLPWWTPSWDSNKRSRQ